MVLQTVAASHCSILGDFPSMTLFIAELVRPQQGYYETSASKTAYLVFKVRGGLLP